VTELGEVHELLLARKGGWVRNNQGDHKDWDPARCAKELGDIIRMRLVDGHVEGVDPLAAMVDRSERKIQQ
jgi:hypothetical protein